MPAVDECERIDITPDGTQAETTKMTDQIARLKMDVTLSLVTYCFHVTVRLSCFEVRHFSVVHLKLGTHYPRPWAVFTAREHGCSK